MAEMGGRSEGRLVSFSGVLTDFVVALETLPAPGGDVLARGFLEVVGGGFNVLAAAGRLGMATAYAGVLGNDPRGQRAREALLAEGVQLLLPEPREGASGVCIVLVDAGGERTMVTVEGVEAHLEASDLGRIELGPEDVVYLSGYDLAYPHGSSLGAWLEATEPAALIFDPGPLIGDLDQALLSLALGLTTWLSLNSAEAAAMTGESSPEAAAAAAVSRGGRLQGVVIRMGGEGCLLALPGEDVATVPAFPTQVLDTTGAGEAHVRAFSAALARGLAPKRACLCANAAASVVVGQLGSATGPGLEQVERILGLQP